MTELASGAAFGNRVRVSNEPERPTTLRERVEAFELDEPGAALPFSSRLAREQGWSHAFAGRVIREYKP